MKKVWEAELCKGPGFDLLTGEKEAKDKKIASLPSAAVFLSCSWSGHTIFWGALLCVLCRGCRVPRYAAKGGDEQTDHSRVCAWCL